MFPEGQTQSACLYFTYLRTLPMLRWLFREHLIKTYKGKWTSHCCWGHGMTVEQTIEWLKIWEERSGEKLLWRRKAWTSFPRNGENTHMPRAGACAAKTPEGKKPLSLTDLQAPCKQQVKVKAELQASRLSVKGIPQHTHTHTHTHRPYTHKTGRLLDVFLFNLLVPRV